MNTDKTLLCKSDTLTSVSNSVVAKRYSKVSPKEPMFHYLPIFISILILLIPQKSNAQSESEVRGFFVAAPRSESIPRFITFIQDELATRRVNTLLLRVDYNFEFQSHPELSTDNPLSIRDVKKLVDACNTHGIQLIPQINLLGHQSWATRVNKLLEVYPQFDETPHVKMPLEYKWPNDDGLYCKSYCPQHPDVHNIVFALVDEIMEAFEANAFHAGMDEVFYIGDSDCPRCSGKDRSVLFANEVEKVRKHLIRNGHKLWIWGDRLLDGHTTGLGEWEASINDTHRAIDLISPDVVICDWHYERAEPTAAYFAIKGFDVLTSTWNKPEVAIAQRDALISFRQNANPELASRYRGMIQTIWSSAESFLDEFYGLSEVDPKRRGQVDSFNSLFPKTGENL